MLFMYHVSFIFKKVDHAELLSHVRLFTSPWTIAHQAPLSMGFSRQEYRSGLLFPTSGDPADPGIEPVSLVSLVLAGGFFINCTTWEALKKVEP